MNGFGYHQEEYACVMPQPTVTAVIITYNDWDMLRQCLETVLVQDWPNLDILVVDNCSSDATAKKLPQAFPQVRLLALQENLHYAGACNAGVEHSQSDYIALLNNDIYLPKDFIRRLVEALEARADAAVAGPAVDNMNMDMSRYPYNGAMSLTGAVIHNVFKDRTLAFGAAGCSLVFKHELVGLPFDSDYRFTHEEIYLAWRARLRGYEVFCVPEVVVKHIGGATVSNFSEQNRFLLERNRRLNFLTLFSTATRMRIWPLMLLSRLMERFSDLRAGRSLVPIRKAARWIREHKEILKTKRTALQAQRRVPDKKVIQWMSYKITNNTSLSGRLINAAAYFWCMLVGLSTWELRKK